MLIEIKIKQTGIQVLKGEKLKTSESKKNSMRCIMSHKHDTWSETGGEQLKRVKDFKYLE